jgi:hypothetical protein
MYPSTSLFIAIGQLAIVILVLFSYPLQVHPCRNCVDKIFHPEHVGTSPKEEDDGEIEPGGDEHGHHGELSPLKHLIFTTVIVGGGFTTAYLVSDLQLGASEMKFVRSRFANCLFSIIFRGRHGIHNDLVHPARTILLEGNENDLLGEFFAYWAPTVDTE